MFKKDLQGGDMRGKVCGTGSNVPSHYLDNHALSQMVDTSDEWIRERTGINKRHIARDETVASLAVEAAKRAVCDSKIQGDEIDLIIVATASAESQFPNTACEVQKEIGAVHAFCFDLNAACTGFLYAYNTAQAYFAAGLSKTALVIGADCLSRLVNWQDRNTCILFGDGAGAVVLKRVNEELLTAISHSDGTKGEVLTCRSRHRKDEDTTKQFIDSYIQMNGQEVFRFAVTKVPEVIQQVLQQENLTVESIDYFILHQANKRIVESVAKRLQAEPEKFPMNLQEYGNTSAASIPILLDELNRQSRLKKGQKLIFAGFGAGLTWGATLVEW